MAYVGDISQVLGVSEFVYSSGKSKGIRAYRVNNGRGLDFTVLVDKCLNIPYLSFKGYNIGFVSKVGLCAPEFYQEDGVRGYLRNFEAGFLTTCGLTYMGSPCVEPDGRKLGLHGPISNTPAENASADVVWDGDVANIIIKGKVKEACLFDEHLVLSRVMSVNSLENTMTINDKVENLGFKKQPLMLLYHFNFGYPMLDNCTRVYTNFDKIIARDSHSEKGINNCDVFCKPVVGYQEEVFFRMMSDKGRKDAIVVIHNEELNLGVIFEFDATALPILNHWKNPAAGDYGLGIEPGTSHVGGRERARKEGLLMYIEPGETKNYSISIKFSDDESEIKKYINLVINS